MPDTMLQTRGPVRFVATVGGISLSGTIREAIEKKTVERELLDAFMLAAFCIEDCLWMMGTPEDKAKKILAVIAELPALALEKLTNWLGVITEDTVKIEEIMPEEMKPMKPPEEMPDGGPMMSHAGREPRVFLRNRTGTEKMAWEGGPYNGKAYGPTLIGGALTNRPYLRGMAPIVLPEGTPKDAESIEIWIEFCRVGQFDDPVRGKFAITPEHLQSFVANFLGDVLKGDISTDRSHYPEDGATSWVKRLELRDGGTRLFALVEFNRWGIGLLRGKMFRYFSPEFEFNFQEYEVGEIQRHEFAKSANRIAATNLFRDTIRMAEVVEIAPPGEPSGLEQFLSYFPEEMHSEVLSMDGHAATFLTALIGSKKKGLKPEEKLAKIVTLLEALSEMIDEVDAALKHKVGKPKILTDLKAIQRMLKVIHKKEGEKMDALTGNIEDVIGALAAKVQGLPGGAGDPAEKGGEQMDRLNQQVKPVEAPPEAQKPADADASVRLTRLETALRERDAELMALRRQASDGEVFSWVERMMKPQNGIVKVLPADQEAVTKMALFLSTVGSQKTMQFSNSRVAISGTEALEKFAALIEGSSGHQMRMSAVGTDSPRTQEASGPMGDFYQECEAYAETHKLGMHAAYTAFSNTSRGRELLARRA